MSSRKSTKIKQHPVLLVSMIVVVAAILVLAIGFVYNEFSNHRKANRIANEYSKISIPKTLRLQHQNFSSTPFWLLNSPGKYVGWTYTYKETGQDTLRQTNDALRSSLRAAGYTVDKQANDLQPDAAGNVGAISAGNQHIKLGVTIDAVADSNDPAAVTSTVGVSVYE